MTAEGGDIVRRAQAITAEVDRWHWAVSRACADLGTLRSQLVVSRNVNLAFRRDVKAAQERLKLSQPKAAERGSAMAKLHGLMTEFRCRFDDQAAQLEVSTAANRALAVEVKTLQAELNDLKDKLMEEGGRTVEEKLKFRQKEGALLSAEAARSVVVAELKKVTGE